MKTCKAFFLIFFFALTAFGQLKHKDVKHALESGKVSEISIVSEDQFTPDRNQEMDLKVSFQDGNTVLASDYHFIWDHVECNVSNADWKIKGELLTNGKGLIQPNTLSAYYPGTDNTVTISMQLGGKKATKVLTPNYCIQNYLVSRWGSIGSNGVSGTNGTDGLSGNVKGGDGRQGGKGGEGSNGPDIVVQIDEETIASKTYVVITMEGKKIALDPECSTIKIISQGGSGGKGGSGGRGGDSGKNNKNEYTNYGGRGGDGGVGGSGGMGGTITVSGNAVEKYKSKFTFISEGGKGGEGGSSARGGNGKYSGPYGSTGRGGYSGGNGQVIFKGN